MPALHFELRYYQAIEWAISQNLQRVEAGAQGTHKIARGYRPEYTWSCHYIAHPGLRAAVSTFLDEEAIMVLRLKDDYETMLPFKKSNCD